MGDPPLALEGDEQMPRLDYSHTYRTCIHSMKRANTPWRVTSGCESRVRLFTGKHYELPNQTVCMACPFYCKNENISIERRKK